jgi:hypothetical protein
MARYAIVVSLTQDRTTVHSERCRCVEQARARRLPVTVVEAEDAGRAAAAYSERHQFKERGLNKPKICKCAT